MQISRNERITICQSLSKADDSHLIDLATEELLTGLQSVGICAGTKTESDPQSKTIYIGAGWNSQVDAKAISLTCDGIVVHCLGENALILSGGSARGTLNAVYAFLEDYIGITWANPAETLLPKASHWSFKGVRLYYNPGFSKRALSTASALDARWAARRRLNLFTNLTVASEPCLSGSHTFAGKHCHNVYKLLSLGYFGTEEDPSEPYERRDLIEKLFLEHPEYFGLVNGRRIAYPEGENADISSQNGNISLTHPAVIELLVKGARILLDHYPKSTIISLSLRDNYDYCEDAKCYRGGVVKALVDLVNRFASLLETTHPHIRIDFLAYHGTQRPPFEGIFHPNVTVRYCPIRISQFHAFDESKHNTEGGLNYETPPSLAQPVRQLKRWKEMAQEVVVWYYTLHLPYFHPHPSLRPHSRNFKLMRDLGVTGVFIQDNSPIAQNQFNDLRAHLLAKLLWNPDTDYRREIAVFCEGYYGGAASDVIAYIQLLHEEASWDWEMWPEVTGKSRWASDKREESWNWFQEEAPEEFPVPHFYILYHTRPPLKAAFFKKAWPILQTARKKVEGNDLHSSRLDEIEMSFYYGALSHPERFSFLDEVTEKWFLEKFQTLKAMYATAEFHGLSTVGLAAPYYCRSLPESVALE